MDSFNIHWLFILSSDNKLFVLRLLVTLNIIQFNGYVEHVVRIQIISIIYILLFSFIKFTLYPIYAYNLRPYYFLFYFINIYMFLEATSI